MKVLLRSIFNAGTSDDNDGLYKNVLTFTEANIGFDIKEDGELWEFIRGFAEAHHHVPTLQTIRAYFDNTRKTEVVDRLEVICNLTPIYQGDFIRRLEERSEDRKRRILMEVLADAGRIAQTGLEVVQGKEKRIFRGPVDAVRYISEHSNEIIVPTLGSRLGGNALGDTEGFVRDYNRVKMDPEGGLGQFSGIKQWDDVFRGARKKQMWTHAAFTGGLKCLHGSARIWDLNTGRLRSVEEIFTSGDLPRVHSLEESTLGIVHSDVSHVVQNGVRDVFEVLSENGMSVKVSGNHPFLTHKGWKNAEDLTTEDWLAIPKSLQGWENESPSLTDAEVAILGYLIGDGTISTSLSLSVSNKGVRDHFIECLQSLGYIPSTMDRKNKGIVYREYDAGVQISMGPKSRIFNLLNRLGLWGHTAGSKFVPSEIWSVSDKQVCIFLSALWSTDGCVGVDPRMSNRVRGVVYSYTSKSKVLAKDVQLLLQRVGISSTMSEHWATYKGERRLYWSVLVTTLTGKRRFAEILTIKGKEKDVERTQTFLPDHSPRDEWFPASFLDFVPDHIRARSFTGGWLYARHLKPRQKVSRDTILRFADVMGSTEAKDKVNSDVRWTRVKSVTYVGKDMTYDLCVPETHNFVVEGFITHNTTIALNWVYNQAVYMGYSSCFFSLEMPFEQLRNILCAMHSMHGKFRDVRQKLGIQKTDVDVGLEYSRIRDALLTPEEENFLLEWVVADLNECTANGTYGKILIESYDPDSGELRVQDISARCHILYDRNPFHMLVVDHALLVSPKKWVPSQTDRGNEVVRDLKKLAMTFGRGMGMAVLNLFQINREGYKQALKNAGKYTLTALSYANEVERSSDIVTTSWFDEDERKQNRALIQTLKSRDDGHCDDFYLRAEMTSRRVLTSFDVPMIEAQKRAMGERLDSGETLDSLLS